jgi:hypothetical protein
MLTPPVHRPRGVQTHQGPGRALASMEQRRWSCGPGFSACPSGLRRVLAGRWGAWAAAVHGGVPRPGGCRPIKHSKEARTVDLLRFSPHTDTSVVCSIASTFPLGISMGNEPQVAAAFAHRALSGVHFYRWEPRFLALPVAPDAKRRFRMDSSGFGLALCLDDILGYDREQFIHLENRFRAIFPQIKTIRLMQEPAYRGRADDRLHMPMLEQADGRCQCIVSLRARQPGNSWISSRWVRFGPRKATQPSYLKANRARRYRESSPRCRGPT